MVFRFTCPGISRLRSDTAGGHGRDLDPDCEFGSDVVRSSCFSAGFLQVEELCPLFLIRFLSSDLSFFFALSTRAFFVVTGPETLLAGVPTSLAVTSLADYSGRVMIEVAHGNTKVVQAEEFQGGDVDVYAVYPKFSL